MTEAETANSTFWLNDLSPQVRRLLDSDALICDTGAKFESGKKLAVFNYRNEGEILIGVLRTPRPYRGLSPLRQFDIETIEGEILAAVPSCLCCRVTKRVVDVS